MSFIAEQSTWPCPIVTPGVYGLGVGVTAEWRLLRIRQHLSNPSEDHGRMKKETKIVTLEPELEAIAGNFTAHQRVMLAKRFFRWAKQLYVSADILRASAPKLRPSLPKLSPRRLALN